MTKFTLILEDLDIPIIQYRRIKKSLIPMQELCYAIGECACPISTLSL